MENEPMQIDFDEMPELLEPEAQPVTRNSLELYYEMFFPYKQFFKWLGNEDSEYFERREFSFTLENEAYIRYQCFRNDQELKNAVKHSVPIKIDIGAVFNTLPRYNNSKMGGSDLKVLTPLEKELVFDIDMTDYDDVRTCCKAAKICNKCWKYMVVAYKIIDEILKEDFGFEKVTWFFSGRRGIHCWVSDDRARKLTNDARGAVVTYIKLKVGQRSGSTMKEPIHPSLERSIDIIESCFVPFVLRGQEILKEAKIISQLIGTIKNYFHFRSDIEEFISTRVFPLLENPKMDSQTKWNLLVNELTVYEGKTKVRQGQKYSVTEMCLKEFKLIIMYPRLDINVSKHINHLLKSPFCVHPKTGLISVPLNKTDIENFKLDNIPSIYEVLEDLHANRKNEKFLHFLNNFKEI